MSDHVAVVHDNIPVIEAADPATLDHLLADAGAADAIVHRIGPTTAVIDPAKMERLVERLLKLGHLPKVVEG